MTEEGQPKAKPKVGVYVCHCGGNISDYVDVKRVAEEARKEADVVVAKDLMFDCSDASQNEMIDDIKTQKLDRVVVAACSPKLHELTFRGMLERGGLNPYMYYHANIREQSSWAHEDDRPGATEKALGHVRAALQYVRAAEPLERPRIESTRAVLVIGGGVAGMRAALDLSGMDVDVVLVESSSRLGGRLLELGEAYPYGREGEQIAKVLVDELRSRPNVTILTGSRVTSYRGYIGKFEVRVRTTPGNGEAGEEILLRVGSVIVATGFDSYVPAEGEFGYGRVKGVITLPELEALEKAGGSGGLVYEGRKVKDIAFIYCVGSRQSEDSGAPHGEGESGAGKANQYCSRYCCNATINDSLVLNRKFGGLTIYHLYRDIRTYGKNELMYERASREGSIFIRFDEANPPVVAGSGDRCSVTVKSSLLENQPVELSVDLVVLVTGMVPRGNKELDEVLQLPTGGDGFYKEIHQKLRPVETNVAGLLIAGTAQGPKDIRETLASASAAAAKAAAFALKKELELEPFVAKVDPAACELNRTCVKECPYEAIEVREDGGRGSAWVNTAKCKGCGACVAVCPKGAIQLVGLTNSQVKSMIEVLAR